MRGKCLKEWRVVRGEWRVSAAVCSASVEVLRFAPGLDSRHPYCTSPRLRQSKAVSPGPPEILPRGKGTARILQKCGATVLWLNFTGRKRRSSQLAHQPESFILRETTRQTIDTLDQGQTILPDEEVL